eukprot:TRINITY_DN902_c0_g1_i1.p1 TRINITY_DN902_c0_g1~~TRINITY_DN902_c0_g1_i1.p1  ORF type:complete len:556 (-),score=126.47 TRINITY_DN902_c0_g1_i1:414-2081(-)
MTLLLTLLAAAAYAAPIAAPRQLTGFIDFHIHQMAEYAFGGAWFPRGKDGWLDTHKGPIDVALAPCSGNEGDDAELHDHATVSRGVWSPMPISTIIGAITARGTTGDTGRHGTKRYGYSPDDSLSFGTESLLGWPRWDTTAHQQAWEGHLREAWEKGLSVYMMSAVDFNGLCRFMPIRNRRPGLDCSYMNSINYQIAKAHEFVAERDWVEIALSPDDVRRINAEGKLAMVLHIEVSDLFRDDDTNEIGNWREKLDWYYDQGVRSIMILHQLNNHFGGAAQHNAMFSVFQCARPEGCFELDEEGFNMKGLTDVGIELVNAMIDKQMLIDIAHLSHRAIEDVYNISASRNFYPVYISHTHPWSMMNDKTQEKENPARDWLLSFVKRSGGLIGLRTFNMGTNEFNGTVVPNDCDGSSKSFAQVYQYVTVSLDMEVGTGIDVNGFISQTRPRFGNGNETCNAYGDREKAKAQQLLQKNETKLGTAFDYAGLGHVGLLPDLLSDMQQFGVSLSHIRRSADSFVKMWDRCVSDRHGPLDLGHFFPLDPESQSPRGIVRVFQ